MEENLRENSSHKRLRSGQTLVRVIMAFFETSMQVGGTQSEKQRLQCDRDGGDE